MLCLLEVGSYIILRSSNLLQVVQRTVADTTTDKSTHVPPIDIIHPYYGYITNPNYVKYVKKYQPNDLDYHDVPQPNAFGFMSTDNPLQKRDASRIIVALMGGSVACYEGTQGKVTLVRDLEALFHKPVTLLNLALFAGKQPQQLLILTDLIAQGGHFDVVINLDGFNEVALPAGHGNVEQHISPFFPQSWRTIAETDFDADESMLILTLAGVKGLNHKLNAFEQHFSFSYTVRLISILQNKIFNNIAVSMEKTLRSNPPVQKTDYLVTNSGKVFLGPWSNVSTEDPDYYDKLARHWFNCSILLHNLITSQGGVYYHFLQPNQYSHDKTLTDVEKANAIAETNGYPTAVAKGYPVLRDYGKALQAAGVHFYDLSLIFQNTKETVYRDTCCHFNQRGVDAIAEQMADSIRDHETPDSPPMCLSLDAPTPTPSSGHP